MNNGGDAAEQVVRLSLEGFEVAAKLTGTAAKELTVLLISVLKQEQKTKGKARLTNMLKSGKELKVFSIPNKDLKTFTEQAKKYGVLYCVLKDKYNKDGNVPIDIIARAEDASKIHDQSPNAFAIGRRTICVTDGLLNLTDEEIMAVFAHEIGHIAYQHSAIQLLIGGGNLFISGFLLIVKVICWIITGIFALVGISTRSFWGGLFMTLFGGLSTVLIWLWTKFCMLFLMWSMRQNEFVADEYAYKLGYGTILASVLDRHMCSAPNNGLLRALYSTHPHSDDRIARLQELGADYYRY